MHPAYILFGLFFLLIFAGVPIAAALGLAGTVVIAIAGFGIMAVPTSVYTGMAKYPLLAIPMFVLAGAIFDRSGVAARLLRFASAIVGQGRGSLAVITILVAMIIGGISGSGPACTAAVGGVMVAAMLKARLSPGFAASVTAAAGSTDILIPPSVAFIIYSVLVPSATVPALFAAGIGPGILACVMLIIPALLLSLYYNFGAAQSREPKPKLWQSFKEAFWALMAPIVILGGCAQGGSRPQRLPSWPFLRSSRRGRDLPEPHPAGHLRASCGIGRNLCRHPHRCRPGECLCLGIEYPRHRGSHCQGLVGLAAVRPVSS